MLMLPPPPPPGMPRNRATLKNLRLLVVKCKKRGSVPNYVKILGGSAEWYYRALRTLAARREFEAQEALRIFKKAAKDVSQMPIPKKDLSDAALADHELNIRHTRMEREGAALIDIRTHKRWKVDTFGMLALQILLWMWYARKHPDRCEPVTSTAQRLPAFDTRTYKIRTQFAYKNYAKSREVDTTSYKEWWRTGIGHYNRARWRSPELERRLRAHIPRCCRASDATRHTYVLRVLRDRFESFAPEPH